ncbi:MAG: BAX inhibitor (BI)-1/YccA family protein [Gammaproteobacteria bacterium]|nr:BAX inhibitor (BI)-1/YccA family protein [Gammaproteobacteria bacterium]
MVQRYQTQTVHRSYSGEYEQNSVLRNTLILLSLSTLFAACTAYLSFLNPRVAASFGFFGTTVMYFGLLFCIQAYRNSSLGIAFVFALTGFLGYTLGPLLHVVFHQIGNGPQIIATSFLGTGMIFGGLAVYATNSKTDFNYLAGFLTIGSLTLFALSILNILFFQMPMMNLFVASGILMVSSGWLLFELSALIHRGERNYILATVSLFVQLYNIFISLIQILSALSSSRDR